MSTLVVQTSFLGDMVLTTPLLARLEGPVDVLATPAAAGLLVNHPSVRETIVYDKRGAQRGVGGFARMVRTLRTRGYDRALLAQGSIRSGALAALAGIPERIGFATSAGRRFYTVRVPYIENAHHVDRLLALARVEPGPTPRPRLYPGDAERARVDALLDRHGARGDALVALAPGSVWATKRWPGYAELGALLGASLRPIVIGGPGDAPLAVAIRDVNPRAIDATGALSLLESAELLGRCRALVTNDSAPQHLASAMNVPTVSIFGPTVPGFGFGPLSAATVVLGIDSLPCRPCDRHGPARCPLGHWQCMRSIAPATALAAVHELLPD